MKVSRRDLVRSAGALAALPLLSHRAFAGLTRTQPDLILRNGQVITIDPRQPAAEAVAIAGDRILATAGGIGPALGIELGLGRRCGCGRRSS